MRRFVDDWVVAWPPARDHIIERRDTKAEALEAADQLLSNRQVAGYAVLDSEGSLQRVKGTGTVTQRVLSVVERFNGKWYVFDSRLRGGTPDHAYLATEPTKSEALASAERIRDRFGYDYIAVYDEGRGADMPPSRKVY